MATETQIQPEPVPQNSFVNRVVSIPLVADSIDAFDQTLSSNAYTRSPYAHAKGITQTAISFTEPLQRRFSPLLLRADEIANKSLDVVESRYPYPFKTPTEEIVKDLKGRSEHAKSVANKTIDEKVRTPAKNVAEGLDQKIAPIVDYFETAVNKIHTVSHPSSETDTPAESPNSERPKYQYQRAVALSKELTADVVHYSAEQIQQLKAQNALIQRAADTAHKVRELASSGYGAAQEKVHALSDVMLQELQRVQASTANLPAAVQSSLHDLSTGMTSTIGDLSAILKSSDPIPDKVHHVRDTVQERVEPLLEATAARVQQVLNAILGKAAEKTTEIQQATTESNSTNHTTGNGDARS